MAGIQAVCERVHRQAPDAKLILMSIFPRDEKAGCPRRKLIDETNAMIAAFARSCGIVNLDIGAKFLDHNGSVQRGLMPDFCHPSEKGYRIWADALMPMLTE